MNEDITQPELPDDSTDALEQEYEEWRKAFPDLKWDDEDTATEAP